MENQHEKETEDSHFFIRIPSEVLRMTELSEGAKLLYGEILFLSLKNEFCFASNDYFMKLNNVCKRTMNNRMKELRKSGLIRTEVVRNRLTKQVEKRKIFVPKDFGIGDRNVTVEDENSQKTATCVAKVEAPYVPAPKTKDEKKSYGKNQNVLLTDQEKEEYLKVMTVEQFEQAVELYSQWKASTGANPHSDFISMEWAVRKVQNPALKTDRRMTAVQAAGCDAVTDEVLENLPF